MRSKSVRLYGGPRGRGGPRGSIASKVGNLSPEFYVLVSLALQALGELGSIDVMNMHLYADSSTSPRHRNRDDLESVLGIDRDDAVCWGRIFGTLA